MTNNIWEKNEYYRVIEDIHDQAMSSKDPIFLNFLKLLNENKSRSILDFGCGEGWLLKGLSQYLAEYQSLTGLDVSSTGLNRAKERNINKTNFVQYDGNAFPFADNSFDAVISSFAFEHLDNPMKSFQELSRVVKSNGLIIIACPNFGSPLFKSPCNKNKRLTLMINRFLKELRPKEYFKQDFHWDSVEPIILPENVHLSDYDTLCEPNLSSFEKFISANDDKFTVLKINSLWAEYNYLDITAKSNPGKLRRILFAILKFLGINNFLRFQYFGSFFFAAIRKK